jgi:AraC family transcriptional regulator of adaptative response/methylated-DNA-[protein]-cysteine methyltransferase
MQAISNADQLWDLVLTRDRNADGRFVYAVKSTGVFCRPTCPSRRPRREVVEFFPSPMQAEHAGYRPCRRCVPNERNPQTQKVEAACQYIDQHADTPISLSALARRVGASPFYFQRLFKRTLGVSPHQYQQARRAGNFKTALQKEARITDAIYEAGYGSSSRAYESIPAQLGMTPSEFRRNGKGAEIRYCIFPTEFGRVLLATTARGLCAVRFGESEAALARGLSRDFRAATIQRDDSALQPLAERIQELLRGSLDPSRIPLDVRGTVFQQMVWSALRRIPRGETRTYSEIAAAIGKPKAVRAVAGACAANPLALVVPCHRVIQKGGKPSGYRWGAKRKTALLASERSVQPAS